MARMSVYLVYEGPTGIPVTIARLTDPGIVQQVAQLAVGSAEDRAAAIAETDLVWGEVEKVEVIRLRMILNMLLGKTATTATDRQTQHPTRLRGCDVSHPPHNSKSSRRRPC